jgi:hypothetical protein
VFIPHNSREKDVTEDHAQDVPKNLTCGYSWLGADPGSNFHCPRSFLATTQGAKGQ